MFEKPYTRPSTAQIETLLQSLRPNPSENYHQRMALTPWKTGVLKNTGGILRSPTRYRLAALAASVVLLAIILASTPVGRVFANQIIQFFTRASGDTLPLAPEQIQEPVSSATPKPTYGVTLLPAGEAAALSATATSRPTPALEPSQDLSLFEAQTLVEFDLYQPLLLPRDYRLTRILYDPERQAVSLWYASPQAGSGEFFQITEGKNLESLSVGPDTNIEALSINAYPAEFVQGQWFVADGASEATWEGEAQVYTLRWQVEDVTISIGFFLNDSFNPAYLERDEMLAVASDLQRCVDEDDACRVSQAAAAAGFTPWQLPNPPVGLSFDHVDYRPGLTAIQYGSGMNQLTLLQSTQDFTTRDENGWSSAPAGAITPTTVSGRPAEYVRGQFVAQPGDAEAVWDPESAVEHLRWKNGAYWFQIVRIGAPTLGTQPMADLAGQISESALQILPGNQPTPVPEIGQPDVFTTIADLEAVAGTDILEPAVLPEGLAFSHARYIPFSGTAMSFYGSFAPDKLHITGPVLIINQTPRSKIDGNPGDFYPPEALREITVNGLPGQLIRGTLMTVMAAPGEPTPAPTWEPDSGSLMLTWKTDDMTYTIQFEPSNQGARITAEDLLRIAESLH